MSIFDVRRYVSYLNCSFVPHPVKFTAFISKSVEKNKSISSKHGGFKVLPQEKDCLNKNNFFCNSCRSISYNYFCFSCRSIIIRSFQESVLISFVFQLCFLCTKKCRSTRRKFCYQFCLSWNKTAEIMEEVREVGPKNLRKNFRVE